MMKRVATAAGVVCAATVLALASAWWMVLKSPLHKGIANGPWRTSLVAGSVGADMYTRANIAVTGLFALSTAEAVYFFAGADSAGRALKARCTYAIEGKPVAAAWWSVTAYGDDHFLNANAANRFSFNMGNLKTGEGGTFRIVAAPTQQPGDWLPTGDGAGGFNLLLRLYNAAPETMANLSGVALPSINQVGDCA